jgi:hypothetical protein
MRGRGLVPFYPRRKRTLEERFYAKVQKTDSCWVWIGARHSQGYGQLFTANTVNGNPRPEKAHRVAYELLIGPIPDGLQIDHLCRNKVCVNPAHLEAVTQKENLARRQRPAA